MQHSRSTIKLWFDYLTMAIRTGVPIDETYYAEWGTKEKLLAVSFNKWWKMTGKVLFAPDDGARRSAVTVEGSGEGFVIVRIATDVPVETVKRRVSEIVRQNRTRRRTRAFAKFAATGQVNYKK